MTQWTIAILLAVSLLMRAHEENKDFAKMNVIPLRTVCVGRMLIDLPKGNLLDWQQQFDHATVDRLPNSVHTSEAFWTYVQKRKADLDRPTEVNPEGALAIFQKIGSHAVIMQSRDTEVADLNGYYTERYFWSGKWGYKYQTGGLYYVQAAELLRDSLSSFYQVQAIDNFEPSAKPGFCIDGALVTGKIGPIWASPSAEISQWKGVIFNAYAGEDDGSRAKFPWEKVRRAAKLPTPFEDLEDKQAYAQESSKSDDEARMISFVVLRKGEKQIAGMMGQETAFKVKLANGQEYYQFDWRVPDEHLAPAKSRFALGLQAGNFQYTDSYAPPPPADDLFALWDAMLESLRARPGAR